MCLHPWDRRCSLHVPTIVGAAVTTWVPDPPPENSLGPVLPSTREQVNTGKTTLASTPAELCSIPAQNHEETDARIIGSFLGRPVLCCAGKDLTKKVFTILCGVNTHPWADTNLPVQCH